jgi:hypothetical protein
MIHLNQPEHLPPVNCPIVVQLPCGTITKAERTSFIADRSRDMEYKLESGETIKGRYRWTYP